MMNGMDTPFERVLPMAKIFQDENSPYADPAASALEIREGRPGPFCHYFKTKEITFKA